MTAAAPGARMRNVTRPSPWTSGETMGAGACARAEPTTSHTGAKAYATRILLAGEGMGPPVGDGKRAILASPRRSIPTSLAHAVATPFVDGSVVLRVASRPGTSVFPQIASQHEVG